MDFNASPIPEEDNKTFEGHIKKECRAPEQRVETAVDIAHQEHEARCMRLKRAAEEHVETAVDIACQECEERCM